MLPNSDKILPYVFVKDNAFQFKKKLIKPYSESSFTNKKHIFNYRLSRARRIVENVFEILASKFGVLQTTIEVVPEEAQTIGLTYCYLHNFLLKNQSHMFEDLIDKECTSFGWFSSRNMSRKRQTECIRTYTQKNL